MGLIIYIFFYLILLFLLLACSGFFSSAEVAFFSLTPQQLRRLNKEKPDVTRRIQLALNKPQSLLSSILIGNTLVNICTSVVAYSMIRSLGFAHAEGITIPIITILLLIFGEIGPKRIAIHRNEFLASHYAGVLLVVMRATTPIRLLLEQITHTFRHLFHAKAKELSEEEYETLVEMSQDAGVLDQNEADLVKSIMRLEDLEAGDIMTSRMDIIGIDLDTEAANLDQIIRKTRVPRMVLYRNNLDNIESILNVRAYLLDPRHRIEQAIAPPFYIPKCARLNRLLEDFQSRRDRIAIVVDEYGGTEGIVTRGDILEEIAGDVGNEHSYQALQIEPLAPDHWLVDGQISLEDLNEELDLDLKADASDRLAGWISKQAERLPRPGDTVTAQGCRAVVRQMRRHRITLVELSKLEAAS
ncbi:MAG: hemolysin family protein [Kiritimatiellae bacterium]|nr:hemolysin family protein [Kiritimatiellia bacterium]